MATGYILSTDQGTVAGAVSVLSVIPNINLRATGQTALYTVPAGISAALVDVMLLVTSGTSVLGLVSASLGSTTPYTQWSALASFASINTVGQVVSLRECSIGQARVNFGAGSVINFNVGTAATSGTLVVTAFVLGFLF